MQHEGRPTVSPGAKYIKGSQRGGRGGGVGWDRIGGSKGEVGMVWDDRGSSEELTGEENRWVMATAVRSDWGIFQ